MKGWPMKGWPERVADERVADERVARERVARERVARERVARERMARERMARERVARERVAGRKGWPEWKGKGINVSGRNVKCRRCRNGERVCHQRNKTTRRCASLRLNIKVMFPALAKI